MSLKTASVKQLHKVIKKELETITLQSFEVHQKIDVKKQKALSAYKKLQIIKEGKTLTPEVLLALAKLTEMKKPEVDTSFVSHIVNKDSHTISDKVHLNDIGVFLSNQRQYQELLERYNPGLNMDQGENVRKSAQRVGLEVPE